MLSRQAANAYRQAYEHRELTPIEQWIQVVDGLSRNLALAKKAHGERRFDQMWTQNTKSFRILTVLLSHLEVPASADEETKAAAQWLDNLYRHVLSQLTHILHSPSPQSQFDVLIEMTGIVTRRLRAINSDIKAAKPD